MKFLRHQKDGRTCVGVLDGDEVVTLFDVFTSTDSVLKEDEKQIISEMVPLIQAGKQGLDLADRAITLSRETGAGRQSQSSIQLLAPLIPELILASGGNYSDHRKEKDEAPLAGREPEFFFKPPRAVIGPGEGIEREPRVTKKLDYEVELAVIIGKMGRHILEEKAREHVFGYTVVNDATARDRQVRFRDDGTHFYESGSSKNFDTCCPMGPYLITADEIPNPQNLKLQTRVNGQLRQNNNTSNMTFGVHKLLSFFSTFLTMYPGYVIATGTPGGTAWATDPELGGRAYDRDDVVRPSGYLNVGDEVCCEIENIGILCNPVIAPTDPMQR